MRKKVISGVLTSAMILGMAMGSTSMTWAEDAFSGKVVIMPAGAGHNEAVAEAVEVLRGMDKYKDVEIELMPYEDETYQETMPIRIAGGEQIDILYNGNPIYQQNFVDGNVIVPMTEQVEKYGLDLEATYGDYAKYAYNDGEVYGIPGGATVWGLFYNKKIFDEAGVEYPDDEIPMTWDEYAETAKKLTSGEGGDKTYGALHLTWPMYWYGEAIMALGGGEHFYTEDGKCNIKDPAFAKALERTNKMMNEDKSIRTNADIASTGTVSQAFFTGQYGMFLQGTWTLNWLADQDENPRDFEVGLAPMPVDAGEKQKNWGVCGTFSMTQTTQDRDLSFNVIVDLVRETTKLTSSEIYADQTVSQDKLFKDIVEKITPTDSQITIDQVQSIFLNPEMTFVTEKVTGPKPTEYENIMNEEVDLYFAQEQDLNQTLDNIEQRVNAMLEE